MCKKLIKILPMAKDIKDEILVVNFMGLIKKNLILFSAIHGRWYDFSHVMGWITQKIFHLRIMDVEMLIINI